MSGITRTFDEPFYSGVPAAVSASAVLKYDVVINGRGYLLDLNNPNAKPYSFSSVPMLSAMFLQDRSTQPIGEHSLNSHDYWRRSTDDWSAGAGQKYLDLADSVGNQFHASKGIDPWTQGQIGMLPDTAHKTTSVNTNLIVVVAGTYLYLLDGTAWKYTTDVTGTPSYTTITGTALSGALDMTSDGFTVWVADVNRVYYTTRGNATYAKYHTVDHVATLIKSTKGRLFTANGPTIYTHSGAPGSSVATAYFTHPNPDWTWTAIEGGFDSVYFTGFSGTKSMIYAATIKSDGTALDVPVVVASLPVGEIARSMKAYFSVLIVGTDTGWRAAQVGGQSGQLVLGALVHMDSAPRCFESQDRFVWFGWTDYDALSTGLGRIDLSVFNADVPAYASDLMATVQGVVSSVVTFQNLLVFTVQGSGVWAQITNKVATATVTSGWLNYALADSKIAIKLNIQHRAGAGSFTAAVAVDDNIPQTVGNAVPTNAVAGSNETLAVPQIRGRAFETTFTLSRGTDTTQGPVLDRWTLMVEPAPERRAMFTVPLRLHSQDVDRLGANVFYSAALERKRFNDLLQSRNIVPFQDAEQSYNVIVDDFEWVPYELIGTSNPVWDGTLVAMLKVID